jgi:hypothetical protein
MKWKRGLFRLWLLGAAVWVAYATWEWWVRRAVDLFGSLFGFNVLGAREARYSDVEIFGYLSNDALQVVGVPFVALTVGAAIYWALRGFSKSN